jgi:hypothetical protein
MTGLSAMGVMPRYYDLIRDAVIAGTENLDGHVEI